MSERARVAVIIPALNEALTIGAVIQVAVQSPLVDEVLVVSDGSTDGTADVARRAGATVLEHPENKGKGETMLIGIQYTQAAVLVFLDADLLGFTEAHLAELIEPVLRKNCSMQIGICERGYFLTPLLRFLPHISGQRALHRSVLERLPERFYRGFMIEAMLNAACAVVGGTCRVTILRGLTFRRKYEKVGWPRAVVQYLQMISQVLYAYLAICVAKVVRTF